MLKITVSLYLSLLILNSISLAASSDSKELRSAQKGVITCAFRYIEQRRDGSNSAIHSANHLMKILQIENASELAEYRSRCRQVRHNTLKQRSVSWSSVSDTWELAKHNYPESIQIIVSEWVNPVATCSFVALRASAAFGMGGNAGLALAHCQSRLGLKFLALIPEYSDATTGYGFHLTLFGGRARVYYHQDGPFATTAQAHSVAAGLSLSLARNMYPNLFEGGGIGVGLGATSGPAMGIKVLRTIPTGFDFTEVLEILRP